MKNLKLMAIEEKDMSEIVETLRTNGVNFIKCFFKSNLHLDDELWNHSNVEGKDWRIDFSDGKNYLGSLNTNTDEIDDVITEPSEHAAEKERVKEFRIYVGHIFGTPVDVCIDFNFEDRIYGSCRIYCETTNLSW